MILFADLNSCMLNFLMKAFLKTYEFRNLVEEATFFKKPENSSCIDVS